MPNRQPGEGTVSRRADGRWQAAIQVDGTRKTVYAKTEREAYRKLADLRREAGTGPLPKPGNRTLDDLLELWLDAARPGLKPNTLRWYSGLARVHISPKLGKTKLSRLEPAHIQRLCASLKPSIGKAVYNTLHRACVFGVLWRWLPSNPAERVLAPSYKSPARQIWDYEELRAFLAGTADCWLAPLYTLVVATGCRIGELLALRWDDVQGDTIAIKGNLQRADGKWVVSSPKTRAGERAIVLPNEGVAALQRQKVKQAGWQLRAGGAWEATGYVFTGEAGGPVCRWTVEHHMEREVERLGLPHCSPHGLRHLSASLLLDAGVPLPAVSARLGHAHPSITLAVYAHRVGDADRRAAEALELAFGT